MKWNDSEVKDHATSFLKQNCCKISTSLVFFLIYIVVVGRKLRIEQL